jgi:hypothetical protein
MDWTFRDGRLGGLAARSFLPASVIFAFFAGTSVYLLDRDWASTLFLAPVSAWQPDLDISFGFLSSSLPSLCHAYAFALLIILALPPSRYARAVGALAWLIVASALECLQADVIAERVASGAGSFAGNPVADGFIAYTMNGHFDVADLAATALGVSAAFVATSIKERKT